MGGFSLIIQKTQNVPGTNYLNNFMKMKHRGETSNWVSETSVDITKLSARDYEIVRQTLTRHEIANHQMYTFFYGHHRSIINDSTANAQQPFEDPIISQVRNDDRLKGTNSYRGLRYRVQRKLMANGEIYNYDTLKEPFTVVDLQSESDVEIILPLYIQGTQEGTQGIDGIKNALSQLDGEFSMCLTENVNTFVNSEINVFVARDAFGLRPLYYIQSPDFWIFTSELKSSPELSNSIVAEFPPGNVWSFQKAINNENPFESFVTQSTLPLITQTDSTTLELVYNTIKNLLTTSIISRCNTRVAKLGILLSGGLNSSLIASTVCKLNLASEITFFSIDQCKDSDDAKFSQELVEWLSHEYPEIKINYHVVYIDINSDIVKNSIDSIIYTLECCNPELVQRAIPMYHLYSYIKNNTNIRVVLTGDSLGDLELHLTLQLTDRVSQAFNIEARHPFLYKEYLEYVDSLAEKIKRNQIPPPLPGKKRERQVINKYLLRKAFVGEIPEAWLWRRSSSLKLTLDYNFIQDYTLNRYGNSDDTKESFYYKKIYQKYFGKLNLC